MRTLDFLPRERSTFRSYFSPKYASKMFLYGYKEAMRKTMILIDFFFGESRERPNMTNMCFNSYLNFVCLGC